jgi:hypothetical protein
VTFDQARRWQGLLQAKSGCAQIVLSSCITNTGIEMGGWLMCNLRNEELTEWFPFKKVLKKSIGKTLQ